MLIASPLTGLGTINLGVPDSNKQITAENSVIITQEEVDRKDKADAIDAYFAKNDAPLEGYGMKFVLEAEKNVIDWRLLPAIAMRESTGGKHACKSVKNSVFGYCLAAATF